MTCILKHVVDINRESQPKDCSIPACLQEQYIFYSLTTVFSTVNTVVYKANTSVVYNEN